MKTVNYLVTGPFGINNEGDIVKAKLITVDEDSGKGLLYHPKEKGLCGSFSICEFYAKENAWMSIDEGTYVNVGKMSKDLAAILNKKD